MSDAKTQTYTSHTRYDPLFHFVVLPVLLADAVRRLFYLVRNPSLDTVWAELVAIALVLAAFKIRVYALKVQDRVIRLEERLRLDRVLSDRLRPRIGGLNEKQLVALRFAEDRELEALVERTLANGLTNPEIKKQIVEWRPDYFRV